VGAGECKATGDRRGSFCKKILWSGSDEHSSDFVIWKSEGGIIVGNGMDKIVNCPQLSQNAMP
jgi:hypothetical protein